MTTTAFDHLVRHEAVKRGYRSLAAVELSVCGIQASLRSVKDGNDIHTRIDCDRRLNLGNASEIFHDVSRPGQRHLEKHNLRDYFALHVPDLTSRPDLRFSLGSFMAAARRRYFAVIKQRLTVPPP